MGAVVRGELALGIGALWGAKLAAEPVSRAAVFAVPGEIDAGDRSVGENAVRAASVFDAGKDVRKSGVVS